MCGHAPPRGQRKTDGGGRNTPPNPRRSERVSEALPSAADSRSENPHDLESRTWTFGAPPLSGVERTPKGHSLLGNWVEPRIMRFSVRGLGVGPLQFSRFRHCLSHQVLYVQSSCAPGHRIQGDLNPVVYHRDPGLSVLNALLDCWDPFEQLVRASLRAHESWSSMPVSFLGSARDGPSKCVRFSRGLTAEHARVVWEGAAEGRPAAENEPFAAQSTRLTRFFGAVSECSAICLVG